MKLSSCWRILKNPRGRARSGFNSNGLPLAQRGFDAGEVLQHDRDGLGGGLSGEPRGEGHTGFARMPNATGRVNCR